MCHLQNQAKISTHALKLTFLTHTHLEVLFYGLEVSEPLRHHDASWEIYMSPAPVG